MEFKKEDEIIVVVERKELFSDEELAFQGATSDKTLVDDIMKNMESYTAMRRGSTDEVDTPKSRNAELNFDYKQPIPYIVIRKGDNYFVTERLKGGGESRLHGKLSMGIGGHMNPLASCEDIHSLILKNTIREMTEEIAITSGKFDIQTVGLINDDSEEVSQVHIGILGMLDLDEDIEVTVKEVEQLKGHWFTLDQLKSKEVYSRLENWGKIVVDLL